MMRKLTLLAMVCILTSGAFAQLTNQDEVRYNQYGVAVNRNILTAEEREGILVFESKNGNYKFWLDNRVQIDGSMFWSKKGQNLNKIGNGIAFRRVRFAVKAQINKKWYGEVDINLANGALELEDAYLKFMPWDFINFKAGNFKENISMENTTTSRYLVFIERPMVISSMIPSRHIGFQTNYNNPYFIAQGGVFFQEVKDGGWEPGSIGYIVEENNKKYGVNQGHSFTGRLVVQPWIKAQYGVHLGGGWSYRTPKTDVDLNTFSAVRYSARSLSSVNRKKYLDTDIIREVKNEFMQDYELAGYYGPFKCQGEYIRNRVKRNNGLKTNHFSGWYAQASMMLFGGQQQYDKSAGEFTQPSRGRKWGDLELAFRYDFVDLTSQDVQGGSAEGYTAGINYYINSNVKLMVDFVRINNDRYASGKNKLYVGQDADGQLTTVPDLVVNPKGKGGNKYNSFNLRIEIDF